MAINLDVNLGPNLNASLDAIVHQQENGRWEWLESPRGYPRTTIDGSICTFETEEEAASDRARHLAAPLDAYGHRIRSKQEILHLLRIAAANEIDCDGSALRVVWHPRDASGNNWFVETDECIDSIWDLVTLLQATYSIPEDSSFSS